MPIYEYSCLQCGKRHEIMQKFSDAPLAECPDCGGEMKKLISNTSFVLKGTGWYVTDYGSSDRKKGKDTDTGTPEKKATETKAEGKSETKSETKTETKSETKAA
ncbi:MAG: FmdB family zinc ribbon protein [Thermodesulfovibrionales bacterium]